MLKTVLSVLAGAVAAVLGWVAALFFSGTLTDDSFADIRFGWQGSLVGATALATLLMIWYFSDKKVEPLVTAVCAAIGAAFLWDQRELPFNTSGFDRASDDYWVTVTTMGLIFVLLLLGLRTARGSENRAR